MKFFRFLIVLLLLAFAGTATAWYLTARSFQGFENDRFVDVPKGMSTRGIAALLRREGVIENE